jgi:phosphatidylglycerophosphate synthase
VVLVGLVGVAALLAALEATSDGALGGTGWVIGLACGVSLVGLLTAGLRRAARRRLTPADRITLTRAVLVCGVAALVAQDADGSTRPTGTGASVGVLVALASVALVLDAVDGRVARRTGTVHPLGARFDMETDAFLILVLSVHVAADLGWWVLGIGAARYVLLLVAALSRWAPWLRGQVPARLWRKAVAAYQGIVLTVVSGDVLPSPIAVVALAAGLALLFVSFGTEVTTLRRRSLSTARGVEATVEWTAASSPVVDAGVAP